MGIMGALRHVPTLVFDSPLEVAFWLWWQVADGVDDLDEFACSSQREVSVGAKTYRVDFIVEPTDPAIVASPHWKPIAIELDGHAFHEKTREQVSYRNRRDRALQAAGWKVFHFSFAEFNGDPDGCVYEVLQFARKQYLAAYCDRVKAQG